MSGTDKQICVLGRGRSGTSLVAGLLDKMGIDMGKSRPSSPNNPKGYYEDEKILEILDKYVQPIEKEYRRDKGFEKELRAYTKKGNWGWKSPNTLYLLPSVVKVLDNPHFVVCHRNWKKQAKSIKWAFDPSRTEEEAYKTIYEYYSLLEKFFQFNDYPRFDIKFEDLFNINQEKVIKKLCGFVGGQYNPNLKDFIDPNQPKFK